MAWLFYVPGAADILARNGIVLPFAQASEPAVAASRGARPGGFGGRVNNVVTTGVTLVTINDTLTAIGEGTPIRSVTISAPTGGELAEVAVRPGQIVAEGDVIARFEAGAQQIEHDRAT